MIGRDSQSCTSLTRRSRDHTNPTRERGFSNNIVKTFNRSFIGPSLARRVGIISTSVRSKDAHGSRMILPKTLTITFAIRDPPRRAARRFVIKPFTPRISAILPARAPNPRKRTGAINNRFYCTKIGEKFFSPPIFYRFIFNFSFLSRYRPLDRYRSPKFEFDVQRPQKTPLYIGGACFEATRDPDRDRAPKASAAATLLSKPGRP